MSPPKCRERPVAQYVFIDAMERRDFAFEKQKLAGVWLAVEYTTLLEVPPGMSSTEKPIHCSHLGSSPPQAHAGKRSNFRR